MSSHIPSNNNSSLSGVISFLFLPIFLVCTIALTGYTFALKYRCGSIVSWQHTNLSSIEESAKFLEFLNCPSTSQIIDDGRVIDGEEGDSLQCSPIARIAIGTVVTVSMALFISPPFAFAAGTFAATSICWIVDKVN